MKYLKSIDLFQKVSKDQEYSTVLGGTISIISYTVIFFLLFTELYSFSNSKQTPTLTIENSDITSKIAIHLNISFYSLPCNALVTHYTDTSGKHFNFYTLSKLPLDKSGSILPGILPKPNKQNMINNCGSCYGAELYEGQCCNTCEEVMEAYAKKQWRIPEISTIPQCEGGNFSNEKSGVGCMIYGTLQVKKIPGDFHFKANMPWQPSSPNKHSGEHTVHYLVFSDPGVEFENFEKNYRKVEGFYIHYYMKVVSSYTERGKYYQASFNYLNLNNKQIPEIKFEYDFEPITTVYKSDKGYGELIISLCAIIGGWYASTLLITKILIK